MNLALNPFDKGRKPEKVDDIEKVSDLERAIFLYEHKNDAWEIRNMLTEMVLKPADINEWLKSISLVHDDGGSFLNEDTTILLNCLIDNSYQAGYNDFYLEDSRGLKSIGYMALGTHERKIKLTVDGDVGDNFGLYAIHCDLTLNGNAGSRCGDNMHHSKLHVRGDVGPVFATAVKGCKIIVDGDCSTVGAYAFDSEFTLNGKSCFWVGYKSNYCKFDTKYPTSKCLFGWLRRLVR